MDRYIGLDVHAASSSCAVVTEAGKRVRVDVVETKAEALVGWVRSQIGRRHVCLEEGTQSAWIAELLEPHVQELVVVSPRGREGPKDDARDAVWLAQQLRVGAFDRTIFKPSSAWSALRHAVCGYELVTRDVVRVKNRLAAVFRSRGEHGLGDDLYEREARTALLERLPTGPRRLAELLGQQLDALLPLQRHALSHLREAAESHAVIRRLATAPGIGTIRAAQVAAVVVTPHRFRTARQFWSYCGLAIVMRSSSDWVRSENRWVRAEVARTCGLNRNRNPRLKNAFKGAATTVINQMPDHPLHLAYQRQLAAGTKPNLAKLTLARKIAAIVLAMWKHQEVYDSTRHRATTPA